MSSQIEIEFRACFNKEKFDSLKKYLDLNSQYLGKDNKNVFFFIFKGKLLKVVDEISKDRGKIVLKDNKIGHGARFGEKEIFINREKIGDFKNIFLNLDLPCKLMESYQKRDNYLYDGVEIALKYSNDWGHHAELEIVINKEENREKTEKKIKKVARKLDLKLMIDEELRKFTRKAEMEYNKSSIGELNKRKLFRFVLWIKNIILNKG